MEKKIYDTRVIPYVKKEVRKRKGKEYEVTVHTLNKEERENLSCKPRMLWKNKEQVYGHIGSISTNTLETLTKMYGVAK